MSRRLHLGCGPWKLEAPWENYDRDVDINLTLPFPSCSAQFILCEHVIEHVPFVSGWSFLEECYRVLEKGGVLRLSFPDVTRIGPHNFEPYAKFLEGIKGKPCSLDDVYRSMLGEWGHVAAWTRDTALVVLGLVGFRVTQHAHGESKIPELVGIDRHHLAVGDRCALIESTILECAK